MNSNALRALVLATMLVLAGCAGTVSNEQATEQSTADPVVQSDTTGSVNFYISDERNAISDFEHLNVTISSVGFHQANESDDANESEPDDSDDGNASESDDNTTTTHTQNETAQHNETETEASETEDESETESESEAEAEDGDDGWKQYEINSSTVDLTQLQGANATQISNLTLQSGTYDKVFVYVSNVNGTLTTGEQVNVKLPSNTLHLNQNFEVGPNSSVDFVFDITVFEAGNSGKYILKPVVSQSGTDVPIEEQDEDDEAEDERDSEQEVDSELEAELSDDVNAGENATVRVSENDSALANATVFVNGERVGTTDAAGEFVFVVPDAETLRVKIESGEKTVTLTERLQEGGSGNSDSN